MLNNKNILEVISIFIGIAYLISLLYKPIKNFFNKKEQPSLDAFGNYVEEYLNNLDQEIKEKNIEYSNDLLASVLVQIHSYYRELYNESLLDDSDTTSDFIKNQYIRAIQHFIDHGCDINQKIDFNAIFAYEVDKKPSYDSLKNLIIIPLLYTDAKIFFALLESGLIVNSKDQLDIALFFFERPDFELWDKETQEEYVSEWGQGKESRIQFFNKHITAQELLAIFLHMSEEQVQKEFFKKHPEFKETIKSYSDVELKNIPTFKELENRS